MNFRRKIGIIGTILVFVLLVVYFTGPKPLPLTLRPKLIHPELTPAQIEKAIAQRESVTQNIKPDNEARIIWLDSSRKEKTPYCLVYLHGFSASWKEADPVHLDMAKKFGCNLYLPRLQAHGLNKAEPLLDFDAEKYLESARRAVDEASILGEKVILMGTSTGGTLSLYLASENPEIAGLILYSPNIRLYDRMAFVLSQPWGLQLARRVVKSNYYTFEGGAEVQKYWNTKYRIEALITLKNILDHTMKTENFKKVKQPVLMCYYYKNDEEQDKVVSVPAMLSMFDELGTPSDKKKKYALANVNAHALAAGLNSKDIESVEKATSDFMENVLRVPIVSDSKGLGQD